MRGARESWGTVQFANPFPIHYSEIVHPVTKQLSSTYRASGTVPGTEGARLTKTRLST